MTEAIRILGVDWSRFNSANGSWGTAKDQFSISQIGGYNRVNGIYTQAPYVSQVRAALAKGRHAHTYIWFEVGSDQGLAKRVLDYFLPRIVAPKGSIVALDYESGASGSKTANTDCLVYSLDRIKAAGYKPVLYSGQYYAIDHVDLPRVVSRYGSILWIARYAVSTRVDGPNFNYFPKMDGVAIWQFSSSYGALHLDGNVDVTGITRSGYSSVKPQAVTVKVSVPAKPAVKKEDDDMPTAKWRPVNEAGIGYARSDAPTFVTTDLKKTKGQLKKGVDYHVFEIRDGAADVGTQWANVTDLLLALNPLVEGHKAAVRNTKSTVVSYQDKGQAQTRVLAPGKWMAFGFVGKAIDLGNGQTAPADAFEILL